LDRDPLAVRHSSRKQKQAVAAHVSSKQNDSPKAPTIVAAKRGIPLAGSITVINVFLGWTFIGWVVALAMAVAGNKPTAHRN
jgi:hypothetical protein